MSAARVPTAVPHLAIEIVRRHFAGSAAVTGTFFAAEADAIAATCQRLARRFAAGGTLIVFGEGAQASDAAHVAVEFVHPVIVGKRALPALALSADSDASGGGGDAFARALETMGTGNDIALALCAGEPGAAVLAGLRRAQVRGMLTILVSAGTAAPGGAAIGFRIPHGNPLIAQEVQETLYHVLWELVHVFLEDRASGDSPGPPHLGGAHQALYPFLAGRAAAPAGEAEAARVLSEVSRSTVQKSNDIRALRTRVCDEYSATIAEAAAAVALRFAGGGRLLACGNGGSATDAHDAATDCMRPPFPDWRTLPAWSLCHDVGTVTGVANDVGFDHVYARQVLALGRPQDICLGFSTSGASRNVIQALDAAKRRGLLTIALSGSDGGALARSPAVDHCIVARSDYVPRIQEAHAAAWHALLTAVHAALPRPAEGGRA